MSSEQQHHNHSISDKDTSALEADSRLAQAPIKVSGGREEEKPFELSVLQSLLGATALISASLFYVSWLYHRKYFGAMGIRAELVSYSTQDYILNAKSVLAVSTLMILLLVLARLRLDLESERLRRSIFFSSISGLGVMIVYTVIDILRLWSKVGAGVVGYRSAWMTGLAILALLAYSACASTFLFKWALASSYYKNLAPLIVWSSLVAIATLLISLGAALIGDFEGKYDASVSSRLPIINLATKRPLGFGIQPDMIMQDAGGSEVYVYYHIRLVTQSKDILYVLRPEQRVIPAPVHAIPMAKVYALSFGQNNGPIFTTSPIPIPLPTSNVP